MTPDRKYITNTIRIALALASAILIFVGCATSEPEPTVKDPETTPTQIIHDHRIINSENGKRAYRFETPLLERYELAADPFMECRMGMMIETFDDSLMVESDLVADYAHFDTKKEIWTARGNVIAHNYKGESTRTLYTERLYWDQKKKRIYSDTVARVVDGQSVHVGWNFEADDSFDEWSMKRTKGQMEVQQLAKDSTVAGDSSFVASDPSGASSRPELGSTESVVDTAKKSVL